MVVYKESKLMYSEENSIQTKITEPISDFVSLFSLPKGMLSVPTVGKLPYKELMGLPWRRFPRLSFWDRDKKEREGRDII